MNLVFELISSPWFWADIILSVSGGAIVWWGLSIEKKAEKFLPPADFKPDIFADVVESQKKELERGWRILMTGIVVEVVAAFGISIISGLEIADLTVKSAAANLESKQAEKIADQANERAGKIESDNLKLRAEVAALEIKARGRQITIKQMDDFMRLTGWVRKIPIKISIAQEGKDTMTFAYQLREMLTKAGFGKDETGGSFGVAKYPNRTAALPIGVNDETESDVVFVFKTTDTNETFNLDFPVLAETTLVGKQIVITNVLPFIINQPDKQVMEAVCYALKSIGLSVSWMRNPKWHDVSDFEIFVPIK